MVAPETPRAPEAARPLDASRWGVLALLFASITINLLDRQVLSVMAPLIRDELQISNAQYSYIVFCFLLARISHQN